METVVRDLCEGTAADWDVRVVAAHDRAVTVSEKIGEVSVTRAASFGKANSVPLSPAYAARLWNAEADCVVLHEPNPVAGTTLFVRPPKRLVIWHHSDILRPGWAPPTYGRLQRLLYRRAACVVVSSPLLAARSPLVACASRVEVIPFGIALDRFSRRNQDNERRIQEVRQRFPGPRVLFVGRLVYYKGVTTLIEALTHTAGTLLIAGEGPLESELRRMVSALDLQSRVHFLGRVSDEELPALYQAADVFVLPSVAKTETFGVVQVEAMAAGVPVVSTALPTGVPWVNEDGVSGLVVAPGDARALGQAIGRLVGDDELRARCGHNAAARANALFSRERMLASFRQMIESVVVAPGCVQVVVPRAVPS
jgi:rhamnosyl/mannosyltransferase